MSQVDIVSGRPLSEVRIDKEAAERTRKESAITEGFDLEQELFSEPGILLKKQIFKSLSGRIDELVKKDPECMAYIKVLNAIGLKVAIGKRTADDIIKKELGGKYGGSN